MTSDQQVSQPAAASAPAPAPADTGPAGTPADSDDSAHQWATRAGSVAIAVAIAALGVILLDLALKGRLLGPLIRRLPAPAAAAQPAGEDDTPTVTIEGLPADD